MSTCLHAASLGGYLTVVHLLLQAGAHTDVLDRDQNTPLMLACANSHNDVVKYLVKAGASVTFKVLTPCLPSILCDFPWLVNSLITSTYPIQAVRKCCTDFPFSVTTKTYSAKVQAFTNVNFLFVFERKQLDRAGIFSCRTHHKSIFKY